MIEGDRLRVRLMSAVLAAVLLVAWSLPAFAAPDLQAATPAATTPAPSGPPISPDALAGRDTYQQFCTQCHGETGNGDGATAGQLGFPPSAFADPKVTAGLSPLELFNVAKNGRMERMMPPWGQRLSDQEIWDVIGYAWSLHTSADEVNQGKAVYEANCADCHGPDGKGKPPMLDLSDFAVTAAVSQTTWAQVLAKGRGAMPGFAGKLDAGAQNAVLEYTRGLSFKREFRGPLTPGTGIITGTVINGTTNRPLANHTVTLHIFDGTTALKSSEAKTDDKGLYRFESLSTDPGLTFAVSTLYPDGKYPYGTDAQPFAADRPALNLPVTVYDTTTDPAGIQADRVHLIIEFEGNQMLVAELLVFGSQGNKTYIGNADGVLHITLPKGAQDLGLQDGNLGERYRKTEDGFVDTLALPPGAGSRQILFRYSLPYTPGTMDLVRSFAYPATNVNALIADRGEKVSSPQLADQGVRQTQAGNYISLLGSDLPANQEITLHFTNLPAPGSVDASQAMGAGATTAAPGGNSPVLTYVLIAIVGFGAAVMISWPLLKRRAAEASGGYGETPFGRAALVDALARLDLAHEAGEVSDADYRDRRLHLKAQLADQVRREGSAPAGETKGGRPHGA